MTADTHHKIMVVEGSVGMVPKSLMEIGTLVLQVDPETGQQTVVKDRYRILEGKSTSFAVIDPELLIHLCAMEERGADPGDQRPQPLPGEYHDHL